MNQQQAKAAIERELELELFPNYSSRDDNNPDEELGHFMCYEAVANPLAQIEDRTEPITIKVYDSGEVQLYHDATPYPLKVHSQEQRRYMSMFMNECPTAVELLTKEDWQGLVNQLLEEYGD